MFAGIPQEEIIEEEAIRDEVELISEEPEVEEEVVEEIIEDEVEEKPKEKKNKQASLFDF